MLCLDVGNSHIFGGVFITGRLSSKFRYQSKYVTSDEIGLFLCNVLRENSVHPDQITAIAICSVVPSLDYSIRSACVKYFAIDPFFVEPNIETGLTYDYHNPSEIGADLIVTAIASLASYPDQHLIIVDFGTATTFTVVKADKTFVGGIITPGLRISMESLQRQAAKLPVVEIAKPQRPIAQSTVGSIQAGLYYTAVGSCREILSQLKRHAFGDQAYHVIATGGFASLLEDEGLFDVNLPDLVLDGLRLAYTLNH